MDITTQDIYAIVFKDYPDMLNAEQVGSMLGVSKKTVYKMIHNGELHCPKVGREYRIPKVTLMEYIKILQTQS